MKDNDKNQAVLMDEPEKLQVNEEAAHKMCIVDEIKESTNILWNMFNDAWELNKSESTRSDLTQKITTYLPGVIQTLCYLRDQYSQTDIDDLLLTAWQMYTVKRTADDFIRAAESQSETSNIDEFFQCEFQDKIFMKELLNASDFVIWNNWYLNQKR